MIIGLNDPSSYSTRLLSYNFLTLPPATAAATASPPTVVPPPVQLRTADQALVSYVGGLLQNTDLDFALGVIQGKVQGQNSLARIATTIANGLYTVLSQTRPAITAQEIKATLQQNKNSYEQLITSTVNSLGDNLEAIVQNNAFNNELAKNTEIQDLITAVTQGVTSAINDSIIKTAALNGSIGVLVSQFTADISSSYNKTLKKAIDTDAYGSSAIRLADQRLAIQDLGNKNTSENPLFSEVYNQIADSNLALVSSLVLGQDSDNLLQYVSAKIADGLRGQYNKTDIQITKLLTQSTNTTNTAGARIAIKAIGDSLGLSLQDVLESNNVNQQATVGGSQVVIKEITDLENAVADGVKIALANSLRLLTLSVAAAVSNLSTEIIPANNTVTTQTTSANWNLGAYVKAELKGTALDKVLNANEDSTQANADLEQIANDFTAGLLSEIKLNTNLDSNNKAVILGLNRGGSSSIANQIVAFGEAEGALLTSLVAATSSANRARVFNDDLAALKTSVKSGANTAITAAKSHPATVTYGSATSDIISAIQADYIKATTPPPPPAPKPTPAPTPTPTPPPPTRQGKNDQTPPNQPQPRNDTSHPGDVNDSHTSYTGNSGGPGGTNAKPGGSGNSSSSGNDNRHGY